jgi:cell division septum initiation protein DivIVA
MSKQLSQILEKILNKKFVKPRNANIDCYDCEDVDAFFDEMSDVIRTIYSQSEKLMLENEELQQQLTTLQLENEKLKKRNEELISNGYEKIANIKHK